MKAPPTIPLWAVIIENDLDLHKLKEELNQLGVSYSLRRIQHLHGCDEIIVPVTKQRRIVLTSHPIKCGTEYPAASWMETDAGTTSPIKYWDDTADAVRHTITVLQALDSTKSK